MNRLVVAIAVVFVLAQRVPALAGPPYQTDDPEPTPYRHYEIYINSQFSHDPEGLSGTFPSLEINYGLMPNVQFSVTASLAAARPPGGTWHTGFGDSEVALKVRFVGETANTPQIAFYPAVILPSGDANLRLGDGATKIFLPLWAQKSFGPWSVFGGGGVWRNPGPGKRDYTFSGIAAQKDLTQTLALGAEVFHTGAATIDGRASTEFSVGAIKGLDEHHKLLFSIGRSLDGTNTLSTYVAYELYLGPRAEAKPFAPRLDGTSGFRAIRGTPR